MLALTTGQNAYMLWCHSVREDLRKVRVHEEERQGGGRESGRGQRGGRDKPEGKWRGEEEKVTCSEQANPEMPMKDILRELGQKWKDLVR